MGTWPQSELPIGERLRDALSCLPGVEVGQSRLESSRHDPRGHGVLEITVAGRDLALVIRTKKAVFPRDVRQIIEEMRSESRQTSPRLAFLVAESISPGAKDLLQNEGVGYWDSGGSLFLIAPGTYVLIDRPPPKSLKRTMRTLFSGRRAQAILGILNSPDAWTNVAEIARMSGVSRPTVSHVMTELERQGFMQSRGSGPNKVRRVESPGELLDTWVSELPTLRTTRPRRFFVPGHKADRLAHEIARQLEERGVTYGLTGQAGAQRYAPFLSSFSVVALRVLLSPAVEEAIAGIDGHEVEEGANLEVFANKSEDEFNFRERVDDVWLLSPIQVYLDLLRDTGRSRELAAHLRREKIGF